MHFSYSFSKVANSTLFDFYAFSWNGNKKQNKKTHETNGVMQQFLWHVKFFNHRSEDRTMTMTKEVWMSDP